MAFVLTLSEFFSAQNNQPDQTEEIVLLVSHQYDDIDNFCTSVTLCIRDIRELIQNINKKQADNPGSEKAWNDMDAHWSDLGEKILHLKNKLMVIHKLNWQCFNHLQTTNFPEQELKRKNEELNKEKDLFSNCAAVLHGAIEDIKLGTYPNICEIDNTIRELNSDILTSM